jgi:CheY-like chemotaxis protein
VGVLAGGIAHDFNNILTVIVGNLNLALLPDLDRTEVDHALREAERGALQARDLTQQLLTFAKGGEPVRAAVLLPEMLRQTAEFTVRGSRVKCEFSLPENLWAIHADKGQLGQVVQNLVLNAVQAMPTGGVIRIGARNVPAGTDDEPPAAPTGDCVRLTVSDTGVGIPPEHLPRVFDPYFTTKHQGSGLGLATVYSIITKHQGHIDVRSALGHGTTFNVWMPALRETKPPVPVASAPAAEKFQGRVLLMDDEEAILRMAGMLLKRLGFTVTTVTDGRAAVNQYRAAQAENTPYDLVIMDLTVPAGMGGQEAIAQMRATDPNVRAIVSSGYSSDPVLANFREHGFRGRIAKPYQIMEFIRVVREVLAG